jgi:4-hydroxyphenylpyruvate 3-dimethylallyltransferase
MNGRASSEVGDCGSREFIRNKPSPAFFKTQFLVDHRHSTVNLYFRIRGPITPPRAAEIVALAGVAPPAEPLVEEIRAFVPNDVTVAVTVSLRTGKVERTCFYTLTTPVHRRPMLPDRLADFFAKAPSYEESPADCVGWSFGSKGGTYMKASRAYSGDWAGYLTDHNAYFSGSKQKGPILGA